MGGGGGSRGERGGGRETLLSGAGAAAGRTTGLGSLDCQRPNCPESNLFTKLFGLNF